MGGYVYQASGCNSLGIAMGGNSASEIQPINPFPPPAVPPPPFLPPPPPWPPFTPPPPVHPDVLPRAKIKIGVGRDVSFRSAPSSVLNVTDAMVRALQDEQDKDPRLGGADGFTFAAWVRRANYGSLTDTLFELGSYTTDEGTSSSAGATLTPTNTITLTFGDGSPANAGRRLSQQSTAVSMRYVVQNGDDPQQASALDVTMPFPPWVWTHVTLVHAVNGVASIYFDNDLAGSGTVTLPVKTLRSSHVFGGAIARRVGGQELPTLFRGMLRDVFVTAAAIDEHHRNHLQTHTGPPATVSWVEEYYAQVGRERCPETGCVCSAPADTRAGRRMEQVDVAAAVEDRGLQRIPYGERIVRAGAATLSGEHAQRLRRRLQGVMNSVPNTPTGYISSLDGGNSTSSLGVHGGSDVYIGGQFGDVSYPESAAPVVFIGTTPCTVDVDDSTPRVTHCVTQPLYAADLAGKSGAFQLPLTLYTPQAQETDIGQSVAVPNQATCSIESARGGCVVQFDFGGSPKIDSIRTGSLAPGSVLRLGGGGLNSGSTDPEGYGSGTGTSAAGRRRRKLSAQQSSPNGASSTLEVKIKPASGIGPVQQCGMRDNSGAVKEKTSQDGGTAIGPNSDAEASCKVSASSGNKESAGPYSIEVKQSGDNRGNALLNESDAKVDLVSGKRYHFELEARISSIAPLLAPVHGGIPLTIRGSGFGLNPAAIEAQLGATPCVVDKLVEGGFTCNLAEGQDQYAATDDWEWPSERGVRWQWFYRSTLGGSIALEDAMQHASFPDGADGELLLPMVQPVRRQCPYTISTDFYTHVLLSLWHAFHCMLCALCVCYVWWYRCAAGATTLSQGLRDGLWPPQPRITPSSCVRTIRRSSTSTREPRQRDRLSRSSTCRRQSCSGRQTRSPAACLSSQATDIGWRPSAHGAQNTPDTALRRPT